MKAILFDLDGTLTDTFELWYQSIREFVENHTGKILSKEEYENNYWGMDGRGKIMNLITKETEKIEELYNELQQLLLSKIELVRTFPGVLETVRSLTDKYDLGVISNSSLEFVEAQLSHVGLSDYFKAKIADAKPKPDPESLLRACNELKTRPEDSLFVGDSKFDIRAGENAGIRTIIIGRDIESMRSLGEKINGPAGI